jgi:hypothetical protein
MTKAYRRACFGIAAGFLLIAPTLAIADDDEGACNGSVLRVPFAAIGNSGIGGEASLCIGREGVRGVVKASDLKAGNAYTVWLFYNANPPGRFDSTVADSDHAAFSGRVGGLIAASGSKITLLMFNHGPASSNPDTRAVNLLTPIGGSAAAQAVFTIP